MAKLEDIVTNKGERNYSQIFEEYGTAVDKSTFLPGHYYQFTINIPTMNENWIPRSSEEYKNEPDTFITSKQYFDLNPVGLMLYHDRWQEHVLMLNLKAIHPKYRPMILLAHYNIIEKELERFERIEDKIEEAEQKGKEKKVERLTKKLIPINERRKRNSPIYGVTPSMLQEMTGLKLNYAINNYKLDLVARASLLDWDRFGELPYAAIETRGMVFPPGIIDVARTYEKFENNQLL